MFSGQEGKQKLPTSNNRYIPVCIISNPNAKARLTNNIKELYHENILLLAIMRMILTSLILHNICNLWEMDDR